MRSDESMDEAIRQLEQQILDRRVALRHSLDDLGRAGEAAKHQVWRKLASPAMLGGALVAGFVAARLTRRHHHDGGGDDRSGREAKHRSKRSTSRRVIGALVSASMPLALRAARRVAEPWIERAVHRAQNRDERRYGPS